jgi:hypothetical protein
VPAIVEARAEYERVLAGALERRGLPESIGEAFRLGADAGGRRRAEVAAAVREAQLEAHRVVSGVDR